MTTFKKIFFFTLPKNTMSAVNTGIEVVCTQTNPGSLLTKFVSDHLKYSKIVDESNLLPKFNFISKTNSDKKAKDKISKLNSELKELKASLSDSEDVEEREEYQRLYNEKTAELKQVKTGSNLEDVIDITKFDFIADLNENSSVLKPEDMIDRIFDPELRGYLDIAYKTTFRRPLREDDLDAFKECVDRIGFTELDNKIDIFSKKMASLISDLDRYRIKAFNITFKHPTKTNKNGVEREAYLLKSYKYMDDILKFYTQNKKIDEVIKTIIKVESKKDTSISKYVDNFKPSDCASNVIPDWIKEVESKEVRDNLRVVFNVLKNATIYYKFLENYDKDDLKENFPKYEQLIKKIKEISKDIQKQCKDAHSKIDKVMTVYINLLRKLRKLDPRSDEVEKVIDGENKMIVNMNKLDNAFAKELNDIAPHKFKKHTRERIRYCVEQNIEPKFVETFSEDKESNEFLTTEFDTIMNCNCDIYNRDLYAKFGTIPGLKLPKHYRIAIGMRCVTEVFKEVDKLIAGHKYKDNFTITIMV